MTTTTCSVTVNIRSKSGGGVVVLRLYMHDRLLMDAPAALASEVTVTVPPRGIITNQVVMTFDKAMVEQIGKTWDDMADPSLYVSIDASKSDLTYTASGPVFGIQPGDTAELELKAKEANAVRGKPRATSE
mmetsp:Transcript_3865/g.6463  ORF Transcript_3865/g.6463 Transcript_3865/m.6463 type:complete len:131 (+) Transcript_3865:130-522(+)|eukprot:CAMPEP_0119005822 /NCGR_PEP_ID=MMETSP1176-20130426/1949_1 /TAXON_ID=265551 /ORGANISM="Synedropsis recta cf, Strain CCMP1620" /LENGTH=130 /DNA_ID=CAMNT_0006957669 /DNA_START=118 /DNA_END=510 /DNA_ORIENTATION=+